MFYGFLIFLFMESTLCAFQKSENNIHDIFRRIEFSYAKPETIYDKAKIIFGNDGVIISILLFVTCATICLLSACIYCYYINYKDNKMESELALMAEKLKRYNRENSSSQL